jgi:SAM-dependent methyltransferase
VDAIAWDERYSQKDLVWTAEPNRFLVSEVESLPPGRALDLACGEGRNAVWLAEQGWAVVGVDFSPIGLEKAAGLAGRVGVEVEWVLSDVTTYQPEAEGFDLVAVLYLQLPADELELALSNAISVLVPGGTLLVVAHHADNITAGFAGPQDPTILQTQQQLAALLAGVEVEKAERVTRDAEKDGESGVAIDVLVRARKS